MTGAEAEEDIPLGERKTVTDFCYLLDKSKQLFNGLRSASPSEGHSSAAGLFGSSWSCEGFWSGLGLVMNSQAGLLAKFI